MTSRGEPTVIVAAGGLARETLAALRMDHAVNVIGFLDDDVARHGLFMAGLPVLGEVQAVTDYADARLVVTAGSGAARAHLVERLSAAGVAEDRWITVIHPAASVDPGTAVGSGSVILAGVVTTADVEVGRHAVVMPNVTLTHDDVLGSYATLCAGVSLGGHVTVGHRAYIGMNAAVRQRLHIGDDAVVGMGSVVLEDVPARQIWAGVPARRLVKGPGAE